MESIAVYELKSPYRLFFFPQCRLGEVRLAPEHLLQLSGADLVKITDPTLFWCGDRDGLCPPEQSLDMYRMVNKAELAVIPNADHFTMAQQLDVAAMVLLNFMRRVNV